MEWKEIKSGKVRTIYEEEGGSLIKLVASDRVSAFDKILPVEIPGKGAILTQISKKMFEVTSNIVPNAYVGIGEEAPNETVMKKLKMLPVECIVRGYIFGSLWKDYAAGSREFCGITFQDGLNEGDKLNRPIFTPTTKGEVGEHDENLTFEELEILLEEQGFGKETALMLKNFSIALYCKCAEYCLVRGYILADTKFEFGIDDEGVICLADEVCTPDSSRFWRDDAYRAAERKIVSADKQIIRNFINNKRVTFEEKQRLGLVPADAEFYIDKLPDGLIAQTIDQYKTICKTLTN